MDFEEHPSRTALSRSLLAADAGIDPHRLVTLCCEHARRRSAQRLACDPGRRQVAPVVREHRRRRAPVARSGRAPGRGGIRLEEVVISDGAGQELGDLVRSGGFDALLICAEGEPASLAVLPLAVPLARAHGLAVLESPDPPGHRGWLRRVVGSLIALAPSLLRTPVRERLGFQAGLQRRGKFGAARGAKSVWLFVSTASDVSLRTPASGVHTGERSRSHPQANVSQGGAL